MLLHQSLTEKIIKCYYKVYNELGFGFLEKVYENALLVELRKKDLVCEAQLPIKVHYSEEEVGLYYSDITVEKLVILEIKSTPLIEDHEFQLINYLRATDKEVGLLLSFGKVPQFKRKVFRNSLKKNLKKTG